MTAATDRRTPWFSNSAVISFAESTAAIFARNLARFDMGLAYHERNYSANH